MRTKEMNGGDTARAVVITGASSGIGRACALTLDGLGFRVFAGVRRPADGSALAREASPQLRPVMLDVTDPSTIEATRDAVADEDASLAGLVNNAGATLPCPLEYLPLDGLRQQMEVNLIGHLAVTQALLPMLRSARGRIVNVSSLGGRLPASPEWVGRQAVCSRRCPTLMTSTSTR